MHRIVYVPGSRGEQISLDGDFAYIGHGDGLRTHEWERTLTTKDARGMVMAVREVSVTCTATDDQLNEMRRVMDRDVAQSTPGTLVVDGEWHMGCYVMASETGTVYYDWVEVKLTIALLDGFWWREDTKHFFAGIGQSGIDYPHGHDHDLGFTSGKGGASVKSALDSPVRIVFYGPCVNPYVVVGGNRYEVDVSIPSGSTVTIDATGPRPTVTMRDAMGNERSVFGSAVRDGGLGGGSYAFEPLKEGDHEVLWSGAFAFDLAWRERDSEPPWDR